MKMLIIIIIIIYYYYAEAATYMPCNHTLHNYYKIKDNKKLTCHYFATIHAVINNMRPNTFFDDTNAIINKINTVF